MSLDRKVIGGVIAGADPLGHHEHRNIDADSARDHLAHELLAAGYVDDVRWLPADIQVVRAVEGPASSGRKRDTDNRTVASAFEAVPFDAWPST